MSDGHGRLRGLAAPSAIATPCHREHHHGFLDDSEATGSSEIEVERGLRSQPKDAKLGVTMPPDEVERPLDKPLPAVRFESKTIWSPEGFWLAATIPAHRSLR